MFSRQLLRIFLLAALCLIAMTVVPFANTGSKPIEVMVVEVKKAE